MSEEADIDAYFERIGFAGSIAPTLTTLEQLHLLHPAAIPFENLDPLLQIPVRLELSNLQQKLLFERRGGYCVEQNLLFKAVLETLGYPVRGLGARVLWGHPEGAERPFSHMVLAVDIGGATHIADVGFGGLTLTGPLRLRADVEQQTPHETFRLLGGNPEWRLEARIGEDWRVLYGFDLGEKDFDDCQAINDLASSSPRFRDNLIAARTERGRRLALSNNRLSIHVPGGPSESRLLQSVAELREVLSGPFGISLPQTDRLDPALERVLARGAPD
ncbi:MAG: arylamine N-acetyltransferase [Devosia sp.]|nr:arylamine N-acetyltransferase [Devosia sp.]